MQQSQTLAQKQEQKLTHELSMKLMDVGQVILEIEADYMDCLSRSMQERIREAVENIKQLAEECMTDLTKDRMYKWEEEKPKKNYYVAKPTDFP